MAVSEAPTFLERIPVKNNLKRAWELVILLLLISLLYWRLSSLYCHGLVWLAAFLCEAWFTFVWLLNMNIKWNPVKCITFPERISKRREDLPAVDMFVTTADPKLEPPMVTVNTVLSLLAVDYPAHKLACYVSDDACSPITYYALVEATKFARSIWVPFCKKYHVRVRAPLVYFSAELATPHLCSSDFVRDWEVTKSKYEELGTTIEAAQTPGQLLFFNENVPYWSKLERGNHPSVVKVIWEDKDRLADGIPHLIYVAREKKPKHPHHYKAGAMNVLTRVSGVMTNAPFMLNVDCDMFVNDPEVILHAMCPLLGFHSDQMSGFVQFPQRFHGVLEDDPFGNKFQVLQHFLYMGLEGLQGSFYAGTGCFHRRKVIYGEAPELERGEGRKLCGAEGKPSPKELQRRFGCSTEMKESAAEILSGVTKTTLAIQDLAAAREEAAKQVASCTYELNTCWGEEVGWVYGSTTEDVQTGLRIHAKGWRSVSLDPEPPAFLGSAPLGGPASMTQCKRWATGLLEVLVGRHSPLLGAITGELRFRQCLAYLLLNIWALRSVPELCYALLAPYCAFSNTSFLPKASEPMIAVPTALFIFYIIYTVMEYLECALSARAWWNNQRMHTIRSTAAFLFALLSVVMKVMGVSETTFEVTSKEQSASMPTANGEDLKRFTFDSSPLFIPGTTIMFLNLAALLVSSLRVLGSSQKVNGGPGIGEMVCSGWVVLSFWPFVRGLFSKGAYGLPWSTIAKASILAFMFPLFCKWTS